MFGKKDNLFVANKSFAVFVELAKLACFALLRFPFANKNKVFISL